MTDFNKFEYKDLVLLISEDKMYAYLYADNSAVKIELVDILSLIAKAGIVFGIDERAVMSVVNRRITGQKVQIASGVRMVPEVWDEFEYYVLQHKNTKVSVDETKKIDYKNLNLIENVVWEQVLLKRNKRQEGREGKNIFLETVPKKIVKKPFPSGENTKIAEYDEDLLLASINGMVQVRDGMISVSSNYYVDGNIDYRTGNVVFVGNLHVAGDIKEGFEVRVGGDLEVDGTVEKANIECGGNLIVKNGIIGSPLSVISVKKDCSASYVENSTINCVGNMYIERYITHSSVKVGKKLFVTSKNRKFGNIIGGKINVGDTIAVNRIGNRFNTLTILEAGISPFLKKNIEVLYREIKGLQEKHSKKSKELNFIKKILVSPPDSEIALDVDRLRERQIFLDKKIPELKKNIQKKKQKLQKLEVDFTRQIKEGGGGIIKVYDSVFPGARVIIRNIEVTVRDSFKKTVIFEDEGKIIFKNLE